ncbi:MAG: DUF1569 domain-containing protein [Blastocatellales bacterium]
MKSFLNSTDKKEILERLSKVQTDSQRLWGKMTPHQMICHLNDSFRLPLGERSASSVENLLSRTVMKWVALRAPLPWPHGVKTRPEMDQQVGGTPPDDFERDRRELEKLIERFAEGQRSGEFAPHPFFGRMDDSDWLRWGYLHCDHHFRQFGV